MSAIIQWHNSVHASITKVERNVVFVHFFYTHLWCCFKLLVMPFVGHVLLLVCHTFWCRHSFGVFLDFFISQTFEWFWYTGSIHLVCDFFSLAHSCGRGWCCVFFFKFCKVIRVDFFQYELFMVQEHSQSLMIEILESMKMVCHFLIVRVVKSSLLLLKL